MAKDFTELIAWQLASELKRRVYEVARTGRSARDWKFVEQMTDAAASAPRNIAEGFGRFDSREFAQFLKIAIGSEHEVRNHLIDAFDRGYISAAERDDAIHLSRRAVTAATRLREYLLSDRNPYRRTPEPQNHQNHQNPQNPRTPLTPPPRMNDYSFTR